MRRVRLFHWNTTEAQPILQSLQAAGFAVDYPNEKALEPPFRALRDTLPDVIAIDLTRLPARGRNQAVAVRADAELRSIPIVFVDGDPAKIARIREELPDALYASREELSRTLKHAKTLANAVVPVYNTRTTAEKLGIWENMRIGTLGAFRGYESIIGMLPKGAMFEEDPDDVLPVTIWFVRDAQESLAVLPKVRGIAAKSRLWVAYRKVGREQNARAGLNLRFIRDSAANFGLTHYKTCALNTTWAGMALALSK